MNTYFIIIMAILIQYYFLKIRLIMRINTVFYPNILFFIQTIIIVDIYFSKVRFHIEKHCLKCIIIS